MTHIELWGFETRPALPGSGFGLFEDNPYGPKKVRGGGPGAPKILQPPDLGKAKAEEPAFVPIGGDEFHRVKIEFNGNPAIKGMGPTFSVNALFRDDRTLGFTKAELDGDGGTIDGLKATIDKALVGIPEEWRSQAKVYFAAGGSQLEPMSLGALMALQGAAGPDLAADEARKSAREAKETTERLKKQLAKLKLMMESIDTGSLEGLRAFLNLFRTVMRDVANMMEGSLKKISIDGQEKVTASHERLSGLYRKMPQKMDKSTAGLNGDIEQERGYQGSVTNIIESAMSFARSIMTDTEGLDQGINSVIASIDRYLEKSSSTA